jgi:crotonobetainyl-CoA:carnitine CoA-transferase CaiB-like acyl-CoA transferase
VSQAAGVAPLPEGLAGALRGRRVIEIAGGLAGEHCGHALAGLGAEVLALRAPGDAAWHPLDADKRIVRHAAYAPDSFEAVAALAAGCDLLLEDRPPHGWPAGGPLAPRLLARHPAMIALCLSPWGLEGPDAGHAAHPLTCYHAGGHAQHMPCDPLRPQDRDRAPLQAGGEWGEAQAGTLAALVGAACLLDPSAHAGRVVDCARQEALMSLTWPEIARQLNEGRSPTRLAPLATIVGGVLPALDGHVQVAVREDHQWAALATLLERPEWAVDPCFATRAARMGRAAEIAALLAERTRARPTAWLHAEGRRRGIPMAAVLDIPALLSDADLARRGAWRTTRAGEHAIRLPRWDRHVAGPLGAAAPPPAAPPAVQPGRPLAGLRVLDVGWVAMGPYAGFLLACLGAEVTHLGRPPDQAMAGVDRAAYNYGFDTLNTGKAWIGVDLKRPEGAALAQDLAARADVVLENFRPGVAARLGLGYAALARRNPRLVMLSASTYGEAAMEEAFVGYAPVFAALSGLAHLTGHPDGPPTEVSHPVDFLAGAIGVLGIVAGLHRLARTGLGCHLDLAAREAILWSLSHAVALAQAGPGAGGRRGNGHPGMAPHGVYRCRGENRWVAIAVGSDDEWQALRAQAGWAEEARLATAAGRIAHAAELEARLAAWTEGQEAAPLVARLRAAGVAVSLSATGADLCADAHLRARGVFRSQAAAGGPRWHLAPPWAFSPAARQGIRAAPPRHALQTLEGRAALQRILGEQLGLPAAQIEALEAARLVAARGTDLPTPCGEERVG